MGNRRRRRQLHPGWWTLVLIVSVVSAVTMSMASFNRSFTAYVPVTLTADRAGLVMEAGGKVKLRGVQVGRVSAVDSRADHVTLRLEIYRSQIRYLPANIGAQIRATTAFGAKYVDLIYPDQPSSQPLAAGAVLRSRNVSTEVNTVFQNLVDLLKQIDTAKLNAVLTAVADGVRGQGERIGRAVSGANDVLTAMNARSETIDQDWRSLAAFSDTYSAAAGDIIATLDAAATTSATITDHSAALDTLLLNVTGLALSGVNVLGPNERTLVDAVNILEPTTNLLLKYNPEYTCLLMGAKWILDNGGYAAIGGNGRTNIVDSTILLGADPYRYPDNLPIVAAKNGPGGKPGCGSLPDASKNFPVRQLVTNTGWGTGVDIRRNPGIGHPCYADYLPVTRAIPAPPSIRCQGPPAPDLPWPPPGPLPAAVAGNPPGPPSTTVPAAPPPPIRGPQGVAP